MPEIVSPNKTMKSEWMQLALWASLAGLARYVMPFQEATNTG
jgi:hypothetical protein